MDPKTDYPPQTFPDTTRREFIRGVIYAPIAYGLVELVSGLRGTISAHEPSEARRIGEPQTYQSLSVKLDVVGIRRLGTYGDVREIVTLKVVGHDHFKGGGIESVILTEDGIEKHRLELKHAPHVYIDTFRVEQSTAGTHKYEVTIRNKRDSEAQKSIEVSFFKH